MTEEEIVCIFIKAHVPPCFEEIFHKLEEYDEFMKMGKKVNVSTLKCSWRPYKIRTIMGKSPH